MVTALALHPAKRRRMREAMPEPGGHEVELRPFGGGGGDRMIVGAAEQDFIAALLADTMRPDWHPALNARRGKRRGGDRVLELSQPIHRRFHLVLLEAVCRQPGQPRVDPRTFDGMGLVLRREESGGWQGWMNDGPAKRGWLAIVSGDLDPDPQRRASVRGGAAGQIDRMAAGRRGGPGPAEQVLPIFAAPADVCAKAGRTVLYGLVPVTSGERSEVPVPAPDYAALPAPEAAAMRDHLSSYLKQRPGTSMPRAGERLDPAWSPLDLPADRGTADQQRLRSFAVFLRQLHVELDIFEDGAAAAALLSALETLALPMARDGAGRIVRTMNAAAFLRAAMPVLVRGEPNASGIAMPLAWPGIDASLGTRLTQLALACLSQRFAKLVPERPKFEGDARRYAVRVFVRVKGHPACAPKLVWSCYSEPFRILPWWDGDGPPVKISLPNISDFRKLKPNVSFELPPPLANMLAGDMKKLKDGEGSTGGVDIFWLCSFSIPIITLCAFIVLNIFLSLFDLFLRWLAWIKICIPIPRPK